MVGAAEGVGKLLGFVEPEDSEKDLVGGFVPADFEDVGDPQGEVGEVAAGRADFVVQEVGFVVDWMGVNDGRVGKGGLVHTEDLSEAP